MGVKNTFTVPQLRTVYFAIFIQSFTVKKISIGHNSDFEVILDKIGPEIVSHIE